MQEDSNYFIWNKGDVYYLDYKTKFFKTSEFDCKCSLKICKEQRIHKDLIAKLVKIREQVAEPVTVTSGFRCSAHQEQIRKEGVATVVGKTSTHELGHAADIKPTRMFIDTFLKFCEKQFYAIGIAKSFLHVDLRGQEDQKKRRWNY